MQFRRDAAHSILQQTGVPGGWKVYAIGQVANMFGGGTPNRNEGSFWRNGSIPWITPTDLTANANRYISNGEEHITEAGLRGSNATLLETGTIIFSSRGTVGNLAIAKVPLTINQSCEALRPKWEGWSSLFMYYLLAYGMSAFHRLAGGTTFGAITRREIARVQFAFPPPAEQEAIAQVLEAADVAIEQTRAAIGEAKAFKRSLTRRLFNHGTRSEAQKRTVIGLVPESWEVMPVSEVVSELQYGLSVAMQQKGTLPILRMGDIQEGDILLDNLKYVSLPDEETAPFIVERGDVLFNRVNSQEHVGKVGLYRRDEPVVFASYLIRVVPDPAKADNYYLGHLLNSYPVQCRIKRYATPGVQQVNVNATNLGKVLIPVPAGPGGLAEQRKIAALLENAHNTIEEKKRVLHAQEALKAALLRDLLTGRVRVGAAALATATA